MREVLASEDVIVETTPYTAALAALFTTLPLGVWGNLSDQHKNDLNRLAEEHGVNTGLLQVLWLTRQSRN